LAGRLRGRESAKLLGALRDPGEPEFSNRTLALTFGLIAADPKTGTFVHKGCDDGVAHQVRPPCLRLRAGLSTPRT